MKCGKNQSVRFVPKIKVHGNAEGRNYHQSRHSVTVREG